MRRKKKKKKDLPYLNSKDAFKSRKSRSQGKY